MTKNILRKERLRDVVAEIVSKTINIPTKDLDYDVSFFDDYYISSVQMQEMADIIKNALLIDIYCDSERIAQMTSINNTTEVVICLIREMGIPFELK